MLKEYFLKKGLLKHKEQALYEVTQDIKFIELFKSEMLRYDENPARKRMAVLKKIEEPTVEQQEELTGIINTLSESKAVKNEHEKSKQLAVDLENYIACLKQ